MYEYVGNRVNGVDHPHSLFNGVSSDLLRQSEPVNESSDTFIYK